MRLEGKRALVTGGGRGIGQAIVLRLAEEGADVAIDYLNNPAEAEATCHEVEKRGRHGYSVQGDVSVPAEAGRIVTDAVRALGGLDILVNNA